MNDLARESLDRGLANQAEMATLHRRKTHSVRIRDVSFRCEPGSRREQILVALLHQDGQGRGMPYFLAGLIASTTFMLGIIVSWWLL